jgi:hypothetical protein
MGSTARYSPETLSLEESLVIGEERLRERKVMGGVFLRRQEGTLNIPQLKNIMHDEFAAHRVLKIRVPSNPQGTLDAITATLKEMWSNNTWDSYASTYNQWKVYAEQLPEGLPFTWQIMMYLEDAVNHPTDFISVGTAYSYSKRLGSMFHKMDIALDWTLLRCFRRALKRRGALVPESQALPLTADHYKVLVGALLQEGQLQWAVALMLAWRTASRLDEILNRKVDDISFASEPDDEQQKVFIRFAGHKGDPFQLFGSIPLFLTKRESSFLRTLCRSRMPGTELLTCNSNQVITCLQRMDPTYTGHSIKRGALLVMLINDVPLELIRIFAKHESIKQLLTYLPSATVAEKIGLTNVAQKMYTLSGLSS